MFMKSPHKDKVSSIMSDRFRCEQIIYRVFYLLNLINKAEWMRGQCEIF